jgi:hypothetical protein
VVAWNGTSVITKLSPRPVAGTVSRLTGILAAQGIKIFAVIDQSEPGDDAAGGRPSRPPGQATAQLDDPPHLGIARAQARAAGQPY